MNRFIRWSAKCYGNPKRDDNLKVLALEGRHPLWLGRGVAPRWTRESGDIFPTNISVVSMESDLCWAGQSGVMMHGFHTCEACSPMLADACERLFTRASYKQHGSRSTQTIYSVASVGQ